LNVNLLWEYKLTKSQAHLNPVLKATRNSTNTVGMHKAVLKIHRHCRKSHTMPSANKLHRPKAPSKAIPINLARLKHPPSLHSLELSLRHQTSSLPTILPTHSSGTRTKITTINNTDCRVKVLKVLKVSKMVQPPSNARSVDIMVLNQRDHLNFRRALLNKLRHVTPLLERVRTAATPLLTRLLNLSNQGLAKVVLNPSPVHNNPAITHMGTLTSPAHTTLRI
jgi:hypothetical protein